ncbi:MAG: hypothetical protein Rhims3KO_26720 [Hyphomicrobiales bacterium]
MPPLGYDIQGKQFVVKAAGMAARRQLAERNDPAPNMICDMACRKKLQVAPEKAEMRKNGEHR